MYILRASGPSACQCANPVHVCTSCWPEGARQGVRASWRICHEGPGALRYPEVITGLSNQYDDLVIFAVIS